MAKSTQLARVLQAPGAVLLGLGAIIGTGVYVSIGIAAGVAGAMIVPALAIAAIIALCNGLSSAQLAAVHPVSGGTYEYGYRFLNGWFGFSAGWLFLVAKSASAATAALGFAGYFRSLMGISGAWQIPLALVLIAGITLVVLAGMRNSSRVNAVLVTVSVVALLIFVWSASPVAWMNRETLIHDVWPASGEETLSLLHAAALMFVAFTGYGRVATLGEEVVEPRTTIPHAIIWTVLLSFALYVIVAAVAVGSTDANALGVAARDGLPLSWVAQQLEKPVVANIIAIGALFAMAGVLLNLVLGLSRVVLAMARRRDMPARLAILNTSSISAPAAVVVVGTVIALIALSGDIRAAWSFSAFTVLIYYAITNLAALRVLAADRFIPRAISVAGLVGCFALAWFVEMHIWLTGLAIVALGLGWHWVAQTRR